ncbi:hypothetical protein TIFTF001_015892 [Ficus carica]|uniref:Uncharacterized protein n=1 Tax=Ficus carica TaxID=3494 RepID=A0AA88D9D6_FICCA|nr:hypothetical protein TIFTF001_015892 [Ficus carica]
MGRERERERERIESRDEERGTLEQESDGGSVMAAGGGLGQETQMKSPMRKKKRSFEREGLMNYNIRQG